MINKVVVLYNHPLFDKVATNPLIVQDKRMQI